MQAKHKIATGAKTDELLKLMKQAGGCLESRISRIYLEIDPPTIDDNIADFERLRRALDNAGFDASHLHMNYMMLSKLAHVLREGNWKVTVSVFNVTAKCSKCSTSSRATRRRRATARPWTSAPPPWSSTSWT